MRLWIIGNGFDLYHGLKTSYADYKAFLCQRNTCKLEHNRIKPEQLPREVCRNCCKDKDTIENSNCPVRKFNSLPRKNMRKDLWRDVEEACSFNLDEFLTRINGWPWDTIESNGKSAQNPLLHDGLDFAKLFTGTDFIDWLREAKNDLSETKNSDALRHAIHQDDLFLTFNYTDTPKLYGIPDEHIFYVHGSIGQVENALIKEKKLDRRLKESGIVRSFLAFGSPDLTDKAVNAAVDRYATEKQLCEENTDQLRHTFSSLARHLTKDVQSRLKPLKTFVNEHSGDFLSLEEVIVAGHSLGKIDRPYFNYLTKRFRCAKWRFLFYSSEDMERAVNFCVKHKLDGGCVPWNCAKESIQGSTHCPGFSIRWSKA